MASENTFSFGVRSDEQWRMKSNSSLPQARTLKPLMVAANSLCHAALPWLTVLAICAILQALTYSDVLPARSFPLVTDVLGALLREAQTPAFWGALGHTLQGWGIGLVIVTTVAVPLGILLGSSRIFYRGFRTLIEFLRPVPSVALIPLAVLVFGTGLQSKVFLVSFAAFWPMLIQTIYGVQDTDPIAAETARTFGLGPVERFWRITLPGTAPFIATGFRLASATALILAVTAELVIGSPGLGASIEIARSGGAVATTYALILTTGLLGWMLNTASRRIEERVLHWHPSQRVGATT